MRLEKSALHTVFIIIYGYIKKNRVLKTVDLFGTNFRIFLQFLVLFLFLEKCALNLIIGGTMFSENGTIR